MVVLDLLKEIWIYLLKILEYECKKFMIFLHNFAIGECSSSIDNVVVLFEVKKIVLLLIIFILSMDFVLDNKCHIAV
jgi:hypothetical protein